MPYEFLTSTEAMDILLSCRANSVNSFSGPFHLSGTHKELNTPVYKNGRTKHKSYIDLGYMDLVSVVLIIHTILERSIIFFEGILVTQNTLWHLATHLLFWTGCLWFINLFNFIPLQASSRNWIIFLTGWLEHVKTLLCYVCFVNYKLGLKT